jgi:NADPH:quinone reductase-like Zn-dependent oxidoreductase
VRAMVYDRYGGPERLRLADVPAPEPGPGEVLVRVAACSVNLSDWEYLTGRPAYARLAGLRRPRAGRRVLGSDVVGHVVRLGEGVAAGDGPAVGQRVMADVVTRGGGFAELACLPASVCTPVPDGLGDEAAACLPQAGAIAVQGTAGVAAGQRVLLNGAGGGSGTLALQLALAAGAHVTAVDNAAKLDFLTGLGAHEVLDHRVSDFAATGRRWDLVLDLVATRGPRRVAAVVAAGGRYRAVGGPLRVVVPLALAGPFTGGRVGVLAVRTGAAETAQAAALAARGALRPVVEDVLALERLPEALARTGAGAVRGKLVIRPNG